MKIIVITGTPGTGKTTVAKKLQTELKNAKLISASKLINEKSLYKGIDYDGAKVADMRGLSTAIRKEIANFKGQTLIIEGHLLSDMRIPGAVAVVLREHLLTLKSRLSRRGYHVAKIRDNIVDEAIDYCGVNAMRNYRKGYEFMSGDRYLMRKLKAIAEGRRISGGASIQLLGELLGIIKSDKRYAL